MLLNADIEILRQAIIRSDNKPEDRTTMLAALQVDLEVLEKFERVTVAFESIAASMKMIADDVGGNPDNHHDN